ncbi:MAG: hypothetical protein U9O82_13535 [Thermodesulfobacteriota bacterium]|nr:hypothetical protein [Thermodesulfobacteriota bacterium]
MAKDPQNSNNTEIDGDSSQNYPDENWGEDWESAFQAEDYMFSPEEGEADSFFQAGSEKPADTDSPAPPTSSTPDFSDETLAADEATVASPDAVIQPAAETPGEKKSPAAKIVTRLRTLFTTIRQQFLALRTYQQILAGVVPVVACLIIAAIFVSSGSEEEFVTTIEPDQQTQQEVQPAGNSARTLATIVLPENSLINEALPDGLPSESEEVSQKWLFSSFFIPAVAQNGQEKITFVSLDLTLVVLLKKGRELPEYKKIFVRDLIYQFYLNQPLYELRRYSMARGEMAKKLHAWILKQWPEGSIYRIIINRYQLV